MALVAASALDLSERGFLDRFPAGVKGAIQLYGAVTGATGRYRFFAPDVGSSILLSVEAVDATGHRQAVPLHRGREADLRTGPWLTATWSTGADAHAIADNRALLASYAARLFVRLPSIRRIVMTVRRFELPSMSGHRSGQRGRWIPVHEATFERARPPAPG